MQKNLHKLQQPEWLSPELKSNLSGSDKWSNITTKPMVAQKLSKIPIKT